MNVFLGAGLTGKAVRPAPRNTFIRIDMSGASYMAQKILIIEDEDGIIHLLNL